MKRALTMCLAALMVIFCMPLAARAASESVNITVAADKTTLNPGDTVNFEVKLGPVEHLGGLDFNVLIPEGLTIDYDSLHMQDGLKDILKSDGNIVPPTEVNNLRWAYSVGDEGYTGTEDLTILSFTCTVNEDSAFEQKTVTLNMRQCFDDDPGIPVDIAVNLIAAQLTVEKAKIPVSGVTLDRTAITLRDGETAKLTAAVVPANADNQNVNWSSDNTAVATVAADGTVTAVKEGTANITVTTEDGGMTASCAVTVTCAHTMEKTEAVEPTCGKDGSIEYYICTKCGRKYSDEAGTKEVTDTIVPATGNHGETEVRDAVAATEETEGYTGDTYCKVCGNKIKDGETIPKLPHTHVMTKTEAVEPDCENAGNVEYYTCTKCGKTYADEAGTKELTDVTVKAKGHTGGDWEKDETNHWKVCTVCGKEFGKAAHDYKWIVDKAATEDETGLAHEECSQCGSRRSENTVLNKLDHVHTGIEHHEAVAATCMTKGNVEYWTCSSEKCKGKYYGDAACQVVLTGIETPVNDNHVGTGKWDRTAEKHVYTCSCGKVLTDEAHKYENEADSDCNVCGYKRFYVVTAGAGAVYEAGSEAGLTIIADGAFELFKELEIDGKVVDPANYEAKAGSTVITLKKAYLDTLPAAEHTARIVYTDGMAATTTFTVKAKDSQENNNNGNNNNTTTSAGTQEQTGTESPKTSDSSQLIFWIVLAVSSLALMAGVLVYGRKKMKR